MRSLALQLIKNSVYGDFRIRWDGDYDLFVHRVRNVDAHLKSNGQLFYSVVYVSGDSRKVFRITALLRNAPAGGADLEYAEIGGEDPRPTDTRHLTDSVRVRFFHEHWEEINSNSEAWSAWLVFSEDRFSAKSNPAKSAQKKGKPKIAPKG